MRKYITVDEFLAGQSAEHRDQIEAIRAIIIRVGPNLQENIKWNAPNYSFAGVDRLTFNVLNKNHRVQLILHMGTSKKENPSGNPVLAEDGGIVEWKSDIRGVIPFSDRADVKNKEKILERVIRNWLRIHD